MKILSLFSHNEMGILNIDLNNINLDNNFDEDDPDTSILIRLLAWHIKFEKRKALKKELNEELIPEVWHPNRWWNFCVPEDENEFLVSHDFNVYNLRVLKSLWHLI